MKYLVVFLLTVGCSNNTSSLVGKCYKPFVYNGDVVKVLTCSNKSLFDNGSNFCIIERKYTSAFGNEYKTESTIFSNSLEDYAIEVNCSEY